jgi:VanZ family protein
LGIWLLYVGLVTWLSLAPASLVQKTYPRFPHADKVLHFLMYGGLVLLARLAFRDPRHVTIAWWLVPALAVTYGVLMELGQDTLVRYQRVFELTDVAANGLGAAVFWMLSGFLLMCPDAPTKTTPVPERPRVSDATMKACYERKALPPHPPSPET